MRKALGILAIGAVAPFLAAPAAQAAPDPWHYVRSYGHNWSACDAQGRYDVSTGRAGAYDCRKVGSPAWAQLGPVGGLRATLSR